MSMYTDLKINNRNTYEVRTQCYLEPFYNFNADKNAGKCPLESYHGFEVQVQNRVIQLSPVNSANGLTPRQ